MDELRYPIGPFEWDGDRSEGRRREHIEAIAGLPALMRSTVAALPEPAWDMPYRPGGWTVRQVVHHVPDSHLNAWMRFRLALTENDPQIRPYDEAAWAELPDTARTPPEVSLMLLDALHGRWVVLLEAMTAADYARTLRHPEHGRTFTLHEMLAHYAWHGRHHVAHITGLAEREGWVQVRRA